MTPGAGARPATVDEGRVASRLSKSNQRLWTMDQPDGPYNLLALFLSVPSLSRRDLGPLLDNLRCVVSCWLLIIDLLFRWLWSMNMCDTVPLSVFRGTKHRMEGTTIEQ